MLKTVVRGSIVCILVLLMVTLFAVPALAFDARGGDTINIAEGEVVDGDLYLGGGDIIINGTVNGDIFGAGQSLTLNGKVNGGITFAGQTITINGNVSNGVRAAGYSIQVSGSIGRDLLVAGSEVTITGQAVISGDLILTAGNAGIDGRISRDITGSATNVIITNEIGRNIDLKVEKLTITSDAKIQGDLTYSGQKEANIQPGASISGKTTHSLPKPEPNLFPIFVGLAVIWWVLAFLMILVIGIIAILIVSPRLNSMALSVQVKPWQSLGWGAVILIVTPIAAIIVMCTVIGLPLGLIALALYGIALYLAQLPVALLIGRLIIKQNRELGSKGMMIGAMALGLFLLSLVRLIPFIGWIAGLLTIVFGLGTIITSSRKKADTISDSPSAGGTNS
jgi:hypothetical protein